MSLTSSHTESVLKMSPRVKPSPLLLQLQLFDEGAPVTWAAMLELSRCNQSVRFDQAKQRIESALLSIAFSYAEITNQHPFEAKGVVTNLWRHVKPRDRFAHAVVRFEFSEYEHFSAMFRSLACFQHDGSSFGILVDAHGNLLLAKHGVSGGFNKQLTGPTRAPKPVHFPKEEWHKPLTKTAYQDGFFQELFDAPNTGYPSISASVTCEVATLDEYRKELTEKYVKLKYTNPFVDAPIRNRMLQIDRWISLRKSVAKRIGTASPNAEDEQLLALAWRMSGDGAAKGLDNCLRFVHSDETLLGYVSGAPLHAEHDLTDEAFINRDYNFAESNIRWDANRSEKSSVEVWDAFYFSSVRLLEKFTTEENRTKLVKCLCEILMDLANRKRLCFRRVYIHADQRHVQALLATLVNQESAKWCSDLLSSERLKKRLGRKDYPIRCVHLAPRWTISSTAEERFPQIAALKKSYAQLSFPIDEPKFDASETAVKLKPKENDLP